MRKWLGLMDGRLALVEKNLHCSFRNYFCFSWLLFTFVSRFLVSRVIFREAGRRKINAFPEYNG
jgi:hypothetical protein